MTDIREITCSWPRRARWARRMAYAAYASIGAFTGALVGSIAVAA